MSVFVLTISLSFITGLTEAEESRNEDLDFKEKNQERVKNKKNIKNGIKRVYNESDCASPGNEALRKLQVIDTFLPAAIDCVTYLFSLFTLILIVVVYW